MVLRSSPQILYESFGLPNGLAPSFEGFVSVLTVVIRTVVVKCNIGQSQPASLLVSGFGRLHLISFAEG
jgi:hypothetical protein